MALNSDVVATGSEDGIIRVMQIHPNKFRKPARLRSTHTDTSAESLQTPVVGAIASHGDFPIERMKLDRNGKFLGSVSHDECVKLTDVTELFEDSEDEDDDVKSDVTEQAGDAKVDVEAEGNFDTEDGGTDSNDEDDLPEVDEDGDTAMDTSDDDGDAKKERKKEKRKEKQRQKREAKKAVLVPEQDGEDEKDFFADL